jgi:hypothetical protein
MEVKIVLTANELKELLMRAWANCWVHHRTDTNDNGKRECANTIIAKILYDE